MAFLSVLILLCAFGLSNAAGRLRAFQLLNSTYINEPLPTTVCQTNYTDIVTVYDDKDNEMLSKLVNTINGSGAKTTLAEAQLYCRENHTDLVSITNEQENERVKNETKETEFPFWIGVLHDDIEWSDGGRSAYRAKLIYQNEEKRFVITGQGWIQASLPDQYHTLCYKSLIHVSITKMSWEKALDYCNAPGLLRIESKDDQIETERELRRQKISEPVWIGLRQSRLFGFWMWGNGPNVGNWTNWKGGRQPEHQISHHCAVMEKLNGTFKWTDKDCRSKFRVLCEIK